MSPRGLIAACGMLMLSACCSADDVQSFDHYAPHGAAVQKDQHQIVDICIASKYNGEYTDLRDIMGGPGMNIPHVPRCSKTVEGDYYVHIARAVEDGTYAPGALYSVSVTVVHRGDNGLELLTKKPIESADTVRQGENELQTIHRLIMAKKDGLEEGVGEALKGR